MTVLKYNDLFAKGLISIWSAVGQMAKESLGLALRNRVLCNNEIPDEDFDDIIFTVQKMVFG